MRRLGQKTPMEKAFARTWGKDTPRAREDGAYEREVAKNVLATQHDARLAKMRELLDVAKE